jgi:hypothetical protein
MVEIVEIGHELCEREENTGRAAAEIARFRRSILVMSTDPGSSRRLVAGRRAEGITQPAGEESRVRRAFDSDRMPRLFVDRRGA